MWFYIGLWLATSIFCLKVGTFNTACAFVFLSALLYSFWDHDLFFVPENMASFHILIMIPMIITPKNMFWRIFFVAVMIMAVTDIVWMAMPDIEPWLRTVLPEYPRYFPYSVFWWQSLLYIIFTALCFHTLWLCYLTHRIGRKSEVNGDGYIWAYVGDFIAWSKNH